MRAGAERDPIQVQPGRDDVVGRLERLLGPRPDTAQHALRHHEAHDRDRFGKEPRRARHEAVALAYDEPRATAGGVAQDERPRELVRRRRRARCRRRAADHERVRRFDALDLERELGVQPDDVTDPDVLPFGHDRRRAVDVATGEVLERVIAVEAPASLTHLHEPRPHARCRRVDRDRAGCDEVGAGEQLVAREARVDLVRRGAGAQHPAAQPRGRGQPADRGTDHREPAHAVPYPHAVGFGRRRGTISVVMAHLPCTSNRAARRRGMHAAEGPECAGDGHVRTPPDATRLQHSTFASRRRVAAAAAATDSKPDRRDLRDVQRPPARPPASTLRGGISGCGRRGRGRRHHHGCCHRRGATGRRGPQAS